jgi:hypothetical protein
MIWNLAIVAPLAWLAASRPERGAWALGAAYASGAVAWFIGKRACLGAARRRAVHDNA